MGMPLLLLMAIWCHLVSVSLNTNAADMKSYENMWSPKGKLNKPGDFTNCGSNSTKAHLWWNPPKIRFGDTLHVNFYAIPSSDAEDLLLDVKLYLPGQSYPWYDSVDAISCDDIHVYLKFMCPFYKDKPVNVKNYKWYISPDVGFPVGTYFAHLRIIAKKTKDELLCLEGMVVILDD